MPAKSLDDWMDFWDAAPGTDVKKAKIVLQYYVDDSKREMWGLMSPAAWYAASNGRKVLYFCSEKVDAVLKSIVLDDVESLLKSLNDKIKCSYPENSQRITIPKGDQLLLVLEVIKQKTKEHKSSNAFSHG